MSSLYFLFSIKKNIKKIKHKLATNPASLGFVKNPEALELSRSFELCVKLPIPDMSVNKTVAVEKTRATKIILKTNCFLLFFIKKIIEKYIPEMIKIEEK